MSMTLSLKFEDVPAGFPELIPLDCQFGLNIILESAEFSATFCELVTCAHSRRATVR